MKLTSSQTEAIQNQTGAQPVADDHPVTPELSKMFGDHTFFVSASGLHIVEPTPEPASPEAQVITVASWSSPERTALVPHDPRATDVVVSLQSEAPNGSAPAEGSESA